MRILILLIILSLFLASCAKEMTNKEKANSFSQKYVMVDGHVDLPYRLADKYEDVSVKTESGDMDFVRAQAGGLDAPFMSIYVGAEHQKKDEGSSPNKKEDAYEKALSLIDIVNGLVEKYPKHYALAFTPNDIIENKKKGLVSLPMGMENGAPIEGSLEKLNELFKKGIRYITLTHSEWNHISDSSYDPNKKWGGLSPFGEEVVKEMNKLGIMVDISHVSDESFYDVMKIVKAPVIASHSSARHFTPGFERNMDDDMLLALKENGGVIMINFGSSFVTKEANEFNNVIRDSVRNIMAAKGLKEDDQEAGYKIYLEVQERLEYPFSDVKDVADHIDHVVKLIGIDHVGLGSDYDGVGNTLPTGLKSVAEYPNLLEELLIRGYSEEDIAKICGTNVLRVWNEVIKVAEAH